MLICIAIEKTQPLTGTASSDGKGPVSFVGWMALLRAVAELTETLEQSAGPGRDADERPRTQSSDERPTLQTTGKGSLS